MHKILTKCLDLFKKEATLSESLSEILATPENREILLGVKRSPPPTTEKIVEDMHHVLRYSNSSDYAIWAKEAWSRALGAIDKLTKSDLSPSEIDFYRGTLTATLDLLRISYTVRNAQIDFRYEEKNKNGTLN